jgi:hypothetical protein
MLAERRRRPDQRIGPLGFQFGREPWPLQDPYLGPSGRGQVVLGGQVLRECRQKRVPPLVASGGAEPTRRGECGSGQRGRDPSNFGDLPSSPVRGRRGSIGSGVGAAGCMFLVAGPLGRLGARAIASGAVRPGSAAQAGMRGQSRCPSGRSRSPTVSARSIAVPRSRAWPGSRDTSQLGPQGAWRAAWRWRYCWWVSSWRSWGTGGCGGGRG